MEIISGIYQIVNKLNGNRYIGRSVHIYSRWIDHKSRCFDTNSPEYNKVLYKAMRKYGLENFDFEILEKCEPALLPEKEKYWVEYYDSYNHGYNMTPGGEDLQYHSGEAHPRHKLNKTDVVYIRELWASKTISTREMYYEFQDKIAKTGFKKIYTWQTWKDILPELNTPENREWHRNNLISYANPGEKNPKAKISDEEFNKIKTRYLNGEELSKIYTDYSTIYQSKTSFCSNMKKRINKACIDYSGCSEVE